MNRLGRVAVLGIFGIVGVIPTTATGYLGGPLRAEVLGYDPTEDKVFYWLHDGSEAGNPRRTFYFDLRSRNPTLAVEAPSLEVPLDSLITGAGAVRWAAIQRRIQPLGKASSSVARVAVRSDSLGVDAKDEVAHYRLHVNVFAKGMLQEFHVDSFCRPSATIRSVYRIPQRSDLLVVVTYVGRSYYCEDVERPVLLVATPNVE